MELTDLVALSLVPAARRRLVEALELSEQTDRSLVAALEALAGLTLPVPGELVLAAARALARARAADIVPLDRDDPGYPPTLRELTDHPLLLWARGEVASLRRTAVAIVGSRRASHAGLEVAHRLAADLAAAGIAIVSGLARGCDGAAHRGALDAGGTTIAVLGCGVDVVYPPEHDALAERIVAGGGALVSEFAPGTPPLPLHFPLRNRIISGLVRGVVVIEANAQSGSLITAGCAAEQGREVMVVPGPVLAGRNSGGHQLIRDGAALVESAEDVLAVLVGAVPDLPGRTGVPGQRGGSDRAAGEPADAVLAALDVDDPQDLDRICEQTGLAPPAVLSRLSALELSGEVTRHPGGLFVRAARGVAPRPDCRSANSGPEGPRAPNEGC